MKCDVTLVVYSDRTKIRYLRGSMSWGFISLLYQIIYICITAIMPYSLLHRFTSTSTWCSNINMKPISLGALRLLVPTRPALSGCPRGRRASSTMLKPSCFKPSVPPAAPEANVFLKMWPRSKLHLWHVFYIYILLYSFIPHAGSNPPHLSWG